MSFVIVAPNLDFILYNGGRYTPFNLPAQGALVSRTESNACAPTMFLSLSILRKVGWQFYYQKLQWYLGPRKIEIAKAEKMHGPGTMNDSSFF